MKDRTCGDYEDERRESEIPKEDHHPRHKKTITLEVPLSFDCRDDDTSACYIDLRGGKRIIGIGNDHAASSADALQKLTDYLNEIFW